MPSDAAHETLEVVHHIPGRVRLRIPATANAARLSDAVSALPGVRSAVWSPLTRGLLVLYDPERADEAAIVAAIADHAHVEIASPDQAPGNGHRPTVAGTVTSLFSAVDARVTGATGGAVTLGVL